MAHRIVTLLSDFGTVDGYVAEMKAVIKSLAPDAEIIDATHDIPPQDVARARFDVPGGASPTFHGRDVFAPAAARIARGEPLDILGRRYRPSVVMHTPVPRRGFCGSQSGEVIAIDRFGNAITNLESASGNAALVLGLSVGTPVDTDAAPAPVRLTAE